MTSPHYSKWSKYTHRSIESAYSITRSADLKCADETVYLWSKCCCSQKFVMLANKGP